MAVTLVSLRNRTVERRGRQNAWVWQTWRGYYLRVLSGIHLTLLFLALLQKDLFKGMWSLAEGFFNENYCHACHTRFSAVFPLPSCCVSSLFFQIWRLMVKIEHREAPSRRIRIFFNPQLFLCGFGFQPHVSGESEKRNRDFLNPLPEWKLLNTLWIRKGVNTKSGKFVSGDVIKSSPVLYPEYCIQDANFVPRFSLLPDFTTHALLPIEWIRPMCRIRVEGHFRFGCRYLWT